MYKYYKAYKIGFNEGLKDAINDKLKHKRKKFKYINDIEFLSKIYDIGYIEGYNKYMNIKSFKSKKNIV